MRTYTRRQLRQTLGQVHLRDTWVSTTTATTAQAAGSFVVIDGFSADLSLSGQNLYERSTLFASGMTTDARVATFNAGSGAYLSQANVFPGLALGAEFERHDSVPATEKNRALDEAIKRLRVRQEVPVAAVAGLQAYPLPAGVESVLDAYSFATPTATLDRGKTALAFWDVVATATGTEVRISPALGGSAQLVLDAITSVTLAAQEGATVNLPDERLVLFAAEAECWSYLVRRAPRGTADEYRSLRNEAARQYEALARAFKTPVDRPLRLSEAY